ncbi:hypothetical protein RirG_260390 [Rhizophagus irregularis DAOM 197198w]|uniref:Uncharacterized protein n=1 Tax=Rhizophagus irregularis (strain DAOM 197198w) TaxID=1432141 RepID=A0A015L9X1_RHIIW|nr:hypothetical protein RirG_260390 [Rhizophagus irregularis DAOM 197198w]
MCPTSSGKIHTRIFHQPCFRLGSHRDGFKRMKNWLRRLEKKNKKNPSPPLPPGTRGGLWYYRDFHNIEH